MLSDAADARFEDLAAVHLTLVTVIFGGVRNAFKRNLNAAAIDALQGQSLLMCRADASNAS